MSNLAIKIIKQRIDTLKLKVVEEEKELKELENKIKKIKTDILLNISDITILEESIKSLKNEGHNGSKSKKIK